MPKRLKNQVQASCPRDNCRAKATVPDVQIRCILCPRVAFSFLQMIAALLLLTCGAGGLAASSSADFGAFVSAPSSDVPPPLPTPSELVQKAPPRDTEWEPDAKSSENSSVMPSAPSNVTTNATAAGKCTCSGSETAK